MIKAELLIKINRNQGWNLTDLKIEFARKIFNNRPLMAKINDFFEIKAEKYFNVAITNATKVQLINVKKYK